MKICPFCAATSDDESFYCPECGKELTDHDVVNTLESADFELSTRQVLAVCVVAALVFTCVGYQKLHPGAPRVRVALPQVHGRAAAPDLREPMLAITCPQRPELNHRTSMRDFLETNAGQVSSAELRAVANLKPGEEVTTGAGTALLFRIRRVDHSPPNAGGGNRTPTPCDGGF